MENLQIRKDIFLKYSLPIYISKGSIGKLSLTYPTSGNLTIDKLEIVISSIGELQSSLK